MALNFLITMLPVILIFGLFSLSNANTDIVQLIKNDKEISYSSITPITLVNNTISPLTFRKNSYSSTQTDGISPDNVSIYISVSIDSVTHYIEDDTKKGMWIFLLKSGMKNSTASLEYLTENKRESYNEIPDPNYKGLAIKINQNSLAAIVNNGTRYVKSHEFSEMETNKAKRMVYPLSDQKENINLRISLFYHSIIVEVSHDNFKSFNFWFAEKWDWDTESISPYINIVGSLVDEEVEYSISTLMQGTITGEKSAAGASPFPPRENQILNTKISIIENLTKDIDSLHNLHSLLSNIPQALLNGIQEVEKCIYAIDLIHSTLSNETSQSNLNSNSTNADVKGELQSLLDLMRNVTLSKISFAKGDPRETLLNSLNGLKEKQNSMNISIVQMFDATTYSIESIHNKADKMERYRYFEKILFLLIFINAFILFAMYRNLSDKKKTVGQIIVEEDRGNVDSIGKNSQIEFV